MSSLSANPEDELNFFPQRVVTRPPAQQLQRIQRIRSVENETLNPILTPSALDKLKKYLPIGTWATFTALKSWAFSISPDTPPSIPESNCNVEQHDVLIAVLVFSFVSAFSTVFVSQFKYDITGKYVIYPPPRGFTVLARITDPHTDVTFPCKSKAGECFWPVFDSTGNFVYDPTRGLKVLIFDDGVEIVVATSNTWCSFNTPQHKTSPEMISEEMPSTVNVNEGCTVVSSLHLSPCWGKSMIGIVGARYYLDFRGSVWCHALLSVLAFGTLSLFSPDVSKCLYPKISDYVVSAIQTVLLVLIWGITTFLLKDDTASMSYYLTQHFTVSAEDEDEDIPIDLRAVVKRVAWLKQASV